MNIMIIYVILWCMYLAYPQSSFYFYGSDGDSCDGINNY